MTLDLRHRRLVELALTLAAPVVLLAAWETLSRSGALNPRFWPAPSSHWDES